MIVVHAWQHRYAGIDTATHTLELQCRACGAEVVLHPQTKIRAERLLGYLLLPAIFPGLFFLARARRKANAWIENPVVGADTAASDRMGPPPRRCQCGAAAACVAIVKQGTGALPLGVRHDYRCAACARSFAVHDVAGIVFAGVLASVLSAAGALVVLHPPGAAVGAVESNVRIGVGIAIIGAIGWVIFGWRLRGRVAHPLVGAALR